jgi:pyruvate,water dikinase
MGIPLKRIAQWLFPGQPPMDAAEAESLRLTFRERYHYFNLLLSANNSALEIMARLEAALDGTWPFGMSFVRSSALRVSTGVFQIITHIQSLAPGKYDVLTKQYQNIHQQITAALSRETAPKQGPLIIPLNRVGIEQTDWVGPKLANLGEMMNRMNLPVPDGFAITAAAYDRFMTHNGLNTEINRRIQAADMEQPEQIFGLSAGIQQLILRAEVPGDLADAIQENYCRLKQPGEERLTVAMRSSALGEDTAETTFAGQYRSELNISAENLLWAYRQILASKYGVPAMSYRFNRGMRDEDIAMCVGCMRMVPAAAGGVIYTRNPVNIRDDRMFIHAACGLPKSVVDGSSNVDVFIVSSDEPHRILESVIAEKEYKFECYAEEGVARTVTCQEECIGPALMDEQALALARLARKIESYYHAPQDIEWAVTSDNKILLLQCRPLWRENVSDEDIPGADAGDAAHPPLMQGGITASSGLAAGPVFILKKEVDMLRFPKGAVLVTAQALPRWAALLDRASAVLTETGSVAGHLANVCREFGIPAIFGLKPATESLEPDRVITVDAHRRRVYDGRIDALLVRAVKPKNIMKGSPIYATLEEIGRNILPLNLLDPDAPAFKPENCQTLHDITRFCHEKAVQEMFRFGKDHAFPERSSKQLHYKVPMNWWILNLDDGFTQEVAGKYIKMEQIASVPMLALWDGIIAKPWEGPPAIDGKGLMSVMFQSTANPALVTGVKSQYAERNYFMIARNFCSMSSRLGYHFTTVEALVSERDLENYASFQFKGGAADKQRRLQRVRFVGDILEQFGFQIRLTEDHLAARIEKHEASFMLSRLKMLGYLSIHTRQLDMIMGNQTRVKHYHEKITADLRSLFSVV